MERRILLDAIEALTDEDFTHVAEVCHDIANRLPETHGALGVAARTVLGLPEPVIVEVPFVEPEVRGADVTVQLGPGR